MREYEKREITRPVQRSDSAAPMQAKTNGIPNSVLNDVFAGKRQATSEMIGHTEKACITHIPEKQGVI